MIATTEANRLEYLSDSGQVEVKRRRGRQNYFIDNASAKTMEINPDEAFVSICLLAALGSVAVSGRIVSIRGEPIGSISRTLKWSSESFGIKSFTQYFMLYEYFKKIVSFLTIN